VAEAKTEKPKCPVCRARFRETAECSRCGADLEPLMRTVARAWRLRETARKEIGLGRFDKARRLAEAAERARHTEAGRKLLLLMEWLTMT